MLVILLWLVLNSVTFAAPRLAVPPEGVAIGEVAVGSNVVGRVEIRNVGSTTVSVSRVKACCGAKAELSAMKIPPARSPPSSAICSSSSLPFGSSCARKAYREKNLRCHWIVP